MPNFIRSVAPATAAMALMVSKNAMVDTNRSVCQKE